jgi:murein L,D-transpeptidase YcbB/YkuD
MRDAITYVNLNPYWVVPRSIAIKDKLPKLKEDSNYLKDHHMELMYEGTEKPVEPWVQAKINWKQMTPKDFNYYIRQLPGPDNALGVVKFPLQNPWAIYMHDTNEKDLFEESERHRSSGCVRLQQPLDLAAYLLRDKVDKFNNPLWSLDQIRNYVPLYDSYIPGEIDKKVTLTKPMPVYFIYLTAEESEDGSMRFIEDVYGQDTRVAKTIANKRNIGETF